ncbi:MAG: hypothetical protein ACQKBW_02915 [Puniceicoccales bacterium]
MPTYLLADKGKGKNKSESNNTYNWVGSQWYNGWSQPSNWEENSVPLSSENTILNFGTGTESFNNIWVQTQKEIHFQESLGNSTFTLSSTASDKLLEFTNAPVISVDHTGTAIISSNIDLDDDIIITGNNGGTLNLSGVVDGAYDPGGQYWPPPDPGGAIIKQGNSTLIISGNQSNSLDNLVVQDGTVVLDKSNGATAVEGNISVSGGTLLLASSNQIDNNTSMELAGGNFATGGNSETLGSLTLSSTSTIDLGEGGTLNFADSSSSTWSGTLLITNWGNDNSESEFSQIYFGTDASSLTADQVNSISFVNPEGMAPGIYGAKLLANGQLVPFSNFSVIPEPSTVMGGILLTLGAAYMGWRSRRKKLTDAAE